MNTSTNITSSSFEDIQKEFERIQADLYSPSFTPPPTYNESPHSLPPLPLPLSKTQHQAPPPPLTKIPAPKSKRASKKKLLVDTAPSTSIAPIPYPLANNTTTPTPTTTTTTTQKKQKIIINKDDTYDGHLLVWKMGYQLAWT
jgi:hypothetical protein